MASQEAKPTPFIAETPLPNLPPAPADKSLPELPPWTLQSALSSFPAIPTPPLSHPTATTLPFLHHISRLKTTKRAGWLRFSISDPESISDHMYRMAILTTLCPPSLAARLNLDIPRCTKMALVHDMAECIVGDITPLDKVEKEDKSRREKESMEFLCCGPRPAVSSENSAEPSVSASSQPTHPTSGLLSNSPFAAAGTDLQTVWQEYEDNETNEAKFVHDIDKLELLLQMVEYERAADGTIDLGEFARVAMKVTLEETRAWMEQIWAERVEFWKQRGNKVAGSKEGVDVRNLDYDTMVRQVQAEEEKIKKEKKEKGGKAEKAEKGEGEEGRSTN